MWLRCSTFAAIFGLFIAQATQASAPVHGAKAAGMNTAFTAVADDASAILHNPAGIAHLEKAQYYAGGTFLVPKSNYRSSSGNSADTQFQGFFAPHLYLTRPLAWQGVTVGLGIYAPFGVGGRKWPADGPTRYSSIEGTIGTVALNPTLAVKLRKGLLVAIGIDYMRARNSSDSALDQSVFGTGDARIKIKSTGGGWGDNVGLLWPPAARLTLGLAYRSVGGVKEHGPINPPKMDPALQAFFGGASFQTDVRSKIDFPDMIDIGIAWRPSKYCVVDIDAERVGWSSFDSAHLDLLTEVPAAGLNDLSVPQNWRDVWAYKIGVDILINDRLSLRSGYAFLNTPVPEQTLTAANPDADQHNISIGFGWREGEWTVDGFYNLGVFKKRHVNNDILAGRYKSHVHYLGVSVGHYF